MRYALFLFFAVTFPVFAQAQDADLKQRRADYAQLIKNLQTSTAEYKASLDELLALYETEVKKLKERAAKTKELHEANLVSQREVNRDNEAVEAAENKIAPVREQIRNAEIELAAMAAQDPDEIARRVIKATPKRERTPQGRVYYVRFIIVGEIEIYDYTGAVRGRVVKYKNKIKHDSRKQ